MGSKGSQTTTQTGQQTYTPAPQIGAAGTQAINMATQAAGAPFQMPVAPVAPFTPFQQTAFGETLGAQGMAQPYFGIGSQYLAGSAAPISGSDVANYYNPMAANVFANLQDIFGQQMRETTGQATQTAGGVGADRIGVAQANLAKQQGLAAGQTASQLYQQALQAAEQQKQMMAGAGYGFGQMGPAAQAAQLQGIQALLGAGGQQQQLTQAQLNALYQNQLAQIAYPFQTAQYLAGITGGLAPAMGGTTAGTQTTTQPSPTLAAQLLGIGTAGLGLYGGMGGTFSNPFASATPTGPTNMSFNTAGLGGGGSYYYQSGGGIDSDYGKLADKAYRKELGDMVPAAEAGNPIADIMMQDIGGSLPMQTGGVPSPVAQPFSGAMPPQRPQWAQISQMMQPPVSPFGGMKGSRIGYQSGGGIGIKDFLSPVITGDWQGPFSTIGALEGKGPFSGGLISVLSPKQQSPQQGQSASQQPSQGSGSSGIGSGLLNILHSMGMQSGGAANTDQPPPFPGASVPKAGGASPIPFISLQPGSGEFHNTLKFSSPSAGGGSGSGLGDVAKIASAAAQMLPMLMAARGGGVSPFDVGQPFQAGGDADVIDATDLGPVDVTPPSPEQRRDDATAARLVAQESGAPALGFAGTPPPPAPNPLASPTAFASAQQQSPMSAPVANADMTAGRYMLPAADRPYPDALQRDWGQNLARSPWMALVKAGAQMAQTRGPIGSVIGAGLGAGAGELEGQRKELRSEQDINLKAEALYQRAQEHLDEYQREKPGERERLDLERQRIEQEMWKPTGTVDIFGNPLLFNAKTGQTKSAGDIGVGTGAASPENASAYEWAKNNPDNPRAAGLLGDAERYLKTGTLPANMGRGTQGMQEAQRIRSIAYQMAAERGIPAEQMPKQWQQFRAEQTAITRFMSGPQGNTARSLNVVTDHAETLRNLGTALQNGNIQLFNRISQAWAQQTGHAPPTNFDMAKDIVGTELIKALGVAGAGSEAERAHLGERISRAASPEQLNQAIDSVVRPLLGGQLRGLRQQFKTSTGLPEDKFNEMLFPKTLKFLDTAETPVSTVTGFTGRTATGKDGTKLRETTDGRWVP